MRRFSLAGGAWKKLYRYQAGPQTVRELPFGLPQDVASIAQMREDTVDATKDVKLDTTLRAPDGERELEPGDCILFPSGPDGAHKLTTRSDDLVRVLLVSNFALPRAAVQVDSGKMMVRWGSRRDERRWFFLGEDADYWDGEAPE